MRKLLLLVTVTISHLCTSFASAPTEMATSSDVKSPESRFLFTYKVEITQPKDKFSKIRVWIPSPQASNFQKINSTKISTSLKYQFNKEKKLGNKMLFLEINGDQKLPAIIEATYDVTRRVAKAITLEKMINGQYWNPADFLKSDEKVPITGQIAALAREQTSGLTTEGEKIRRLFKYVTDSMTYNKDGTGWGQGDAVWACNSKRGNCTDFHSLLIGMARSQKIAARFEIGFPVPAEDHGVIPGYHCWAWLFSQADHSWLPLDSSEAKKSGKLFEYLGQLPKDRVQFTTGRDIVLEPKQEGAPLNYFIYPYVEVDGRTSSDFKKEFSYKKL